MKLCNLVSTTALWAALASAVVATPLHAHQITFNNGTDPEQVYCGQMTDPTIFTRGDTDNGGPGFILGDADFTNDGQGHYYFIYENARDTHPWKYTLLTPGTSIFISVCNTFHGRIVRGNPNFNLEPGTVNNLGTWVEMGWEAPEGKVAWGDVSLLEGYDGAATLAAMDGSGVATGFDLDLLAGVPPGILTRKRDGSVAIAKTVGDGANVAAKEYELSKLSPTTQASIVNAYKPVIGSRNARFNVTMYAGTY